MKKPFPKLNPLIVIALERHRAEIEAAPFYDRERNVVLPELITELLRITRGART